eukprot:s1669_g9.t1
MLWWIWIFQLLTLIRDIKISIRVSEYGFTLTEETGQTVEGESTTGVSFTVQTPVYFELSSTRQGICRVEHPSLERRCLSQPGQESDDRQHSMAMQVVCTPQQGTSTTMRWLRLQVAHLHRQYVCPWRKSKVASQGSNLGQFNLVNTRSSLSSWCQPAQEDAEEWTWQHSKAQEETCTRRRIRSTRVPPWNSRGHPSTPKVNVNEDAESQAEDRFHMLVNALKNQDGPLEPEVQRIVEEATTRPASSKNMHQAVSKVDKKFKAAKKARQNLQLSWTQYLEESIKRWRTFVEDFAKQDKAAEQKVMQTRAALQNARQQMDKIKERLAKQDEESLKEAEIISKGEMEADDIKMETSNRIQPGISTMLESLENIRVRPSEEEVDEAVAAKRQKTADGAAVVQAFAEVGK